MRRPRLSVPARVLCGGLAVGAAIIAAQVVWSGELKAKGGTVEFGRTGVFMVAGVFVALAAGSGWVAVTGRGGE